MRLFSVKAVRKILLTLMVAVLFSTGNLLGAQLSLQGRVVGKMDVYFTRVLQPPQGGFDLSNPFRKIIANTYHKSNRKYFLTIHSENGGVLINPELPAGASEFWVEYRVTYGTKVLDEQLSVDPKITYEGNNTRGRYEELPFTLHWDGNFKDFPAGSYNDTVIVTIISQ